MTLLSVLGRSVVRCTLTCGGVIDDKEEASSDAHAVSVQKADTQQGSDRSIHGGTVSLQNVPEDTTMHHG